MKLKLDVMDLEEAKLEMQKLSAMYVTQKFIPEVDLFRFSKICADKGTLDVTAATLTKDTILAAIDTGLEAMDTASVTKQGRIIYVSDECYYKMIKSGDWINYRPVLSNGVIDLNISNYNGCVVIPVSATVFNTAATFGAGSNTLTGDAINFMIIDPQSVVAVIKHSSAFLFEPGTHTEGDGYIIATRTYHGLNLLENKVAGVYVNTK